MGATVAMYASIPTISKWLRDLLEEGLRAPPPPAQSEEARSPPPPANGDSPGQRIVAKEQTVIPPSFKDVRDKLVEYCHVLTKAIRRFVSRVGALCHDQGLRVVSVAAASVQAKWEELVRLAVAQGIPEDRVEALGVGTVLGLALALVLNHLAGI